MVGCFTAQHWNTFIWVKLKEVHIKTFFVKLSTFFAYLVGKIPSDSWQNY